MGASVLVQSTLRNSVTAIEGVTITKALRSIPTATIRTIDRSGSYMAAVGNQVEIQDDGVILFGGSVLEVERIKRNTNLPVLETHVSCVGFADRLEKRLAGQFELNGQTAGTIIAYIATNSLTGDLTDTSLVEAGPVIEKFISTYPTVREAYEAVVALSPGYEYYIEPDGKIEFAEIATNPAPFSITTGANVTKLTTRETREDFCNNATAHVTSLLLDPATESFVGDGVAKSWNVLFPIASAPSITVGGVDQTVGITDVDTGKDWYWSDGSTEVHQDASAAAVASPIAIDVTYVGVDSTYVSSVNVASVSARATAENNSGIYQKLIQIEKRLTRADAQAMVDAYVDRHSELSVVLTIETNNVLEPALTQINPGQLLSVSLTGWHAAGDYLVRSVNLQMKKGDNDAYRWQGKIEAVSGPLLRNYVDVFRDISSGGGGASGIVSGSTVTGGAGVYRQAETLVSNLTISAAVAATNGAICMVDIEQTGAFTHTFGPEFEVVYMGELAVIGQRARYMFMGNSTGQWVQVTPPLIG